MRWETAVAADSLGFSPDAGSVVTEQLDVNHVGIAADRAVLNVLLFRSTAGVERDHDLLTAGGADVCAFVPPTAASFLSFLHGDDLFAEMIAAACGEQIVRLTELPTVLYSSRISSSSGMYGISPRLNASS